MTVKLTELLRYHFIEFPSFWVKWLEALDAQVERHNWRALLLLDIPKLPKPSIIVLLVFLTSTLTTRIEEVLLYDEKHH